MNKCIISAFQLFIVLVYHLSFADTSCLVPDNAVWSEEAMEHQLPSDYSAGVIWFQAVTHSNLHDESIDGEAKVIIDYEEVFENCPGSAHRSIFYRNYSLISGPLSPDYGGLYLRVPWFGGEDVHSPISNSNVEGGELTIAVSEKPDRVAHWWTDRFSVVPLCTYSVKVRFKIKGKASLQIGSDWWRDMNAGWNGYDSTCQNSNNCEAWVSDWFSNTQNKYTTITVPLGDRCHALKPENPILPFLFLLN